MPEVPRQRGAAATPCAGLQPGHIPALHRTARGDGRLVVDQPAIEADQDRRPCGASRPRHHLPTRRGRGDWPHGQGYPCRHPPIASAAAMRVIAKLAKTQRKRLDRSAHSAEKRRCREKTLRVRGPIRPAPGVCATADAARREKRLSSGQDQAILTSDGRPLGECR